MNTLDVTVQCCALIAAENGAAVSCPAILGPDVEKPELALFTVWLPGVGPVTQLVPLDVLLAGLDGHAHVGNVHAEPAGGTGSLIALAVTADDPGGGQCFWLSRRSVQQFGSAMFAARLDGW